MPKGQRVLVSYGNGFMTRHAYDEQTFRLARLRTRIIRSTPSDTAAWRETWSAKGPLLQDFVYSYDLAGNITQDRRAHAQLRHHKQPAWPRPALREFKLRSPLSPALRQRPCLQRCRHATAAADDARCGFFAGGSPRQPKATPPIVPNTMRKLHLRPCRQHAVELAYQAPSGRWTRTFGMGGLPKDQWQDAPNNRLTSLKTKSTSAHLRVRRQRQPTAPEQRQGAHVGPCRPHGRLSRAGGRQ